MESNAIIYYGGSFNPPHISHVLFVAALRAYFPQAEVWVSPTYSHAFGKPLVAYDLRLRMLGAAFEPYGGVVISTIERDLGAPASYTVDVVREMLRRFPGRAVYVAVGADILPQLPQWHRYDELRALARFLVFPREGFDCSQAMNIPHFPQVSSSEVRKAVNAGDWGVVNRYVPSGVVDIIRSNNIRFDA